METNPFDHLKQSQRWMPERDLLPAIHGKIKQNPKASVLVMMLAAACLALLIVNVWAVSSDTNQKSSISVNAPDSITKLNNSYNLYQ